MPDPDPSERPSLLSRLFAPNGHRAEVNAAPTIRSLREHQLLTRAEAFAEVRLKDIMVPRADIVAVEESTPLEDLAQLFAEAQHSRLPVYRETLDDPTGFVHIKDVIALLIAKTANPQDQVLGKLKREVLFVPASMPAADLLVRMQSTHLHIALVVDEFGGTDGLVTLEDLVEQVFGEISDEHDATDDADITMIGPNSFEADARADIEDLEHLVGQSLQLDDHNGEADSLGGLVFMLAGRVPRRGEVIMHPLGFEFEVVDADPRKIKRVRAKRVPMPDEDVTTD